jgi:NAD-dependent SIR2 family protein deacetylase
MEMNGTVGLLESVECPWCHKCFPWWTEFRNKPVIEDWTTCPDCGKKFTVKSYIEVVTTTTKKGGAK